jgi:hypothetical protein
MGHGPVRLSLGHELGPNGAARDGGRVDTDLLDFDFLPCRNKKAHFKMLKILSVFIRVNLCPNF